MAVDSILWRGEPLRSTEHCTLEDTPGGHRLAGTVLLPLDGRPGVVRYQVEVDPGWRTRTADVTWADPDPHRLVFGVDGQGRWTVNGSPDPVLDGCLDVDLGFSPSTNTLPIRRLGDRGEEVVGVRAAWVRFPGFTVQPIEQSYQHRGDGHWIYRSGSFRADLDVAPSGLVLTYGDVWTTVAGPAASL